MNQELLPIFDPETARRGLQKHYGYEAKRLRAVPGGMSAAAFEADGRFFLKLYDAGLSATERCTRTLERQLRVLSLLCGTSALGDRLCAPIPTADGRLFYTDGGVTGVLFNWIDGEAVGFGNPYTEEERRQLAAFSRELHSVDPAPFAALCPAEAFNVDFAQAFCSLLGGGREALPAPLAAVLLPLRERLCETCGRLADAARRLSLAPPPFVLCHTDLHGGNVLRRADGTLAVVDWENVQLAPREADLFLFCEEPFFPLFREPAGRELLLYYQVRRDLEDLWEFCRAFAAGEFAGEAAQDVVGHTRRIAAHVCGLPAIGGSLP